MSLAIDEGTGWSKQHHLSRSNMMSSNNRLVRKQLKLKINQINLKKRRFHSSIDNLQKNLKINEGTVLIFTSYKIEEMIFEWFQQKRTNHACTTKELPIFSNYRLLYIFQQKLKMLLLTCKCKLNSCVFCILSLFVFFSMKAFIKIRNVW